MCQRGISPLTSRHGIGADGQAIDPSIFLTPFVSRQRDRIDQWDALIASPSCPQDLIDQLQQQSSDGATEAQICAALRRFRNAEMARIAWRDMAGEDELWVTLKALTDLSERCCQVAFEWAHRSKVHKHGEPTNRRGEPMRLVVLGMGKMGGGELNFSSDIDLIFAYPEAGETAGRKPVTAEQFFTDVARLAIRCLSNVTADGFVYRVDTRLRPFGDSGALVYHFDQMENYYQTHGREWERYALIKARPITGDSVAAERLMKMLEPFVYRRYIDFSVIQSLRDMKAMIDAEVRRKGMQENIKLGRGGIRSVEFIAQAIQLIRGGQNAQLRDTRLAVVLSAIAEAQFLPASAIQELLENYEFLRIVENRLQQWNDEQTHSLPADAARRQWLTKVLGFSSESEFLDELKQRQDEIHQHFQQLIADPESDSPHCDREAALLLNGELESEQLGPVLERCGFIDVDLDHQQALFQHFQSIGRFAPGEQSLRVLKDFFAETLTCLGEEEPTVQRRFLRIIEAVAGRTVYVTLLKENQSALRRLLNLCRGGDWIASEIAAQPASLDVLLENDLLKVIPQGEVLKSELDRLLQGSDGHLDQQMDILRRFRNSVTLRIAAADIGGQMPLMIVSDHLTELAEHIVRAALRIAWNEVVSRHGVPIGCRAEEPALTVIAYGKMGGLELGYGSDLDLVFLYEGSANDMTDGRRSVPREQLMTRVGQKMIHLLSTRTAAGVAYEIDTRLRPSGASGLLVSNFTAWDKYMQESAWTWEVQALVRTRVITGESSLCEKFSQRRRDLLCVKRQRPDLAQDVIEMRQKMRENLDKSSSEVLDLKQTVGGLADIEFLVQFLVLANAYQRPALVEFSDNVRQIESLQNAELLDADEAEKLTSFYTTYRRRLYRHHLRSPDELLQPGEFESERQWVTGIWKKYLESVH